MIAKMTPRCRLRQGLGALAGVGVGALCATLAAPAAQARTAARPTSAPRTGGSIAITLPYGIPDCLDPQKTALGSSYTIFSSVVDPLFSTDNKGRIRPYLATGYTYNASGTALTVSLRHGVRFSNGDPFDANAVKYTFDRGINPATKSPSTGTFLSTLKTTQVVDTYTARLVLKTPYRPLLTQLANAYDGILDPKAPPTCQSVIGTGPFKISNVGAGYNTVTVVRNPNHTFEPPWGRNSGPAYLDKITFRSITSDATRVRACPQTPQLPGLVFDPTGTTSVVAGVAGGRARHPRAVAHPQERRGGGCGASGDRWWTQDRVWMAPTDPGIDQNVRGTGGRFVDTL